MEDRGRTDLIAPLAHALALGVRRLITWGLLDVPLTIVPRRPGARQPENAGRTGTPDGESGGRNHPEITVGAPAKDEGVGPRLSRLGHRRAGMQHRRPRCADLASTYSGSSQLRV
ncbi:hypothetical protein BHQ16_22295 [Mycobacterium shimoidei]|nr:hypothetical protein BHQ16_22295 [Mycobacterium shimoidei]